MEDYEMLIDPSDIALITLTLIGNDNASKNIVPFRVHFFLPLYLT